MLKDIMGRELKIGDAIAYAAGGKRGGLRVGNIYEFPEVEIQERRYIGPPRFETRIRVELIEGRRTMIKTTEQIVRLG